MRRFLASAALLALGLALGACGDDSGGGSPTEQVTEAIESSYAAFAEGDAEAFCDSLTPDYLGDFKDYWDGCDEATLDEINEDVVDDPDALENPEISDVEVEGRNADATVNGDDLEVIEVDGEWKLDDFDVPGGE